MSNYLPRIYFKKSFSGQATLLAVLIATAVAVVTAVGVTTRQNSNVRRSTYTAQTDQAFSCANSSVDKALLAIKQAEDSGNSPLGLSATNVLLTEGNCSYTYTVSALNTVTPIVIQTLTKDQVQEFNVTGVTSGNLDIDFKNVDPTKGSAVEVTHAFQNGSNYEMVKYAFFCPGTDGATRNVSGVTLQSFYQDCDNLSISSLNSSHTRGIIRVRPIGDTVNLSFDINGATDPSQGVKINASGTAGGVTRNIEVLRMNPQLPAIFDYVLYSEEGSIQK